MTTIEYLERPPCGRHALDVMREQPRKRNWVALMIDVDPHELKHCTCDFPALFYVHPNEYQPQGRAAHQGWVRIPGKHKTKRAAWDALEENDRGQTLL